MVDFKKRLGSGPSKNRSGPLISMTDWIEPVIRGRCVRLRKPFLTTGTATTGNKET